MINYKLEPTTFITNNPSNLIENQTVESIKTVYNKNIIPQSDIYAPIHIFGTGSEGNSIYMKNLRLLIDLGFSKKKYLEYDPLFFDKTKYIIITHHHGDHLNPSTLFYVLENYPHIQVMVSPFFWSYVTSTLYKPKNKNGVKTYPYIEKFNTYKNRFIESKATWLRINQDSEFLITPRTIKHGDIVNIALQIYHEPTNLRMLYCTDVDNLNGDTTFYDVFARQQRVNGLNQNTTYNIMFLEANYSEEKIQKWEHNMKQEIANNDYLSEDEKNHELANVYTRAMNNRRHISEDEAFRYIKKFLSDDGLFIPLHASSMFGTLFQ